MRTMYENNNYITYSSILKYLLDSFNASKAFIALPCHKKKSPPRYSAAKHI